MSVGWINLQLTTHLKIYLLKYVIRLMGWGGDGDVDLGQKARVREIGVRGRGMGRGGLVRGKGEDDWGNQDGDMGYEAHGQMAWGMNDGDRVWGAGGQGAHLRTLARKLESLNITTYPQHEVAMFRCRTAW